MKTVVVTRHPALVELLRERGLVTGEEPVVSHATPDQVRGRHVIGVLPLALAAEAASVTEIPLSLAPEDRGKELPVERLREVAGESRTYIVRDASPVSTGDVETWEAVSTNGRHGLAVVHPVGWNPSAGPVEGRLESLGTRDGLSTYRLTPQAGTGRWFLAGDNLDAGEGSAVVEAMDLQSGREAALLVLGPLAEVHQYGYRRRSVRTTYYVDGQPTEITAAEMAAAAQQGAPVDVSPTPPQGALAAALQRARG